MSLNDEDYAAIRNIELEFVCSIGEVPLSQLIAEHFLRLGAEREAKKLKSVADNCLRIGAERMRERAAEAAKSAGYGMVDVLHPHGQPGSYARGEYIGTIDATVAAVNAIRALEIE